MVAKKSTIQSSYEDNNIAEKMEILTDDIFNLCEDFAIKKRKIETTLNELNRIILFITRLKSANPEENSLYSGLYEIEGRINDIIKELKSGLL